MSSYIRQLHCLRPSSAECMPDPRLIAKTIYNLLFLCIFLWQKSHVVRPLRFRSFCDQPEMVPLVVHDAQQLCVGIAVAGQDRKSGIMEKRE